MFKNSYEKIRTIANIFFAVIVISVVIIFISCIVEGENILSSLIIGIIIVLAVYEASLYMHSYADLVENSFYSAQLQGNLLKTLKNIETKINLQNDSVNNTNTNTYTPSSILSENCNNEDNNQIIIEDNEHWNCSKCGKKNLATQMFCSKCGRNKPTNQ